MDEISAIDQLVVAVGGRDEQILQVVDRLGADSVAGLLAAEIGVRGTAPAGLDEHAVNLVVNHGPDSFRHLVTFRDGRFTVEPGARTEVLAEVTYELVDLVRSLYPTHPGQRSNSRDVRVVTWPWTEREGDLTPQHLDEMVRLRQADPEQLSALGQRRFAVLFKAVNAVIAACSVEPESLDSMAARYGSDKWGAVHWYTPHYDRHFADLRLQPVRVLEIGIGGYNYESLGGQSLHMWQRYFPRGIVYGLDIFAKPQVRGPRIQTLVGDQNDPDFLAQLSDRLGPFDIVIDDGSHVNEHVRTSFHALFPRLRPGGHYVIEDLHTAYWPEFGGEAPPGSSRTSVGLLKDLLDQVHRPEYLDEADQPGPADHPSDICVYHNIAFLRKGIAHERGIPDWIKQRADRWINPAEHGRKGDA